MTGRYEIVPGADHTASAAGNVGVAVVGTSFLIGYLEIASETGEATVGTRIEVDHLAPALSGRLLIATARLASVEGRRILFEVEIRQGERVIMSGRHGRAIIKLEKLLARAGVK